MTYRAIILLTLLLMPASLWAQGAIRQGAAAELYRMHCAVCHGNDLRGGAAGSLLIDQWESIRQTDEALAEYIRVGNPERGMPAFGNAMNDREIRALVVFINEMRSDAEPNVEQIPLQDGLELESRDYRFLVEPVADGLEIPWALAFDSAGRGLVTERPGRLRWLVDGDLSEPIVGIPEVLHWGQGGLMDVAFHPDHDENGWESELRMRPAGEWSAFIRYALTDARVRRASDQPDLVGRRLAQVARHVVTIGTTQQWIVNGPELTLQARWSDAQFEDDLNQRRLGSYPLVDISLQQRLSERGSVFVAMENALDRRYPDGITGNGLVTEGRPRSWQAGLNLQF